MKTSFSLLLLLLLGLSQAHPTVEDEYEEDVEEEDDDTLDISTRILTTNNNTDESLLEGDLLVPKTRNAMKCWSSSCKWSKGSDGRVTIPYTIHSHFSSSEKQKILRAMKSFHSKTCIRFVPRKGERNYIDVVSKGGCYSSLGRTGGRQELSLAKRGCVHHGIIQHEFIHALGFQHEQTRSDRDQYVTIVWANIKHGMKHNFQKSQTNNLGTLYDYSSVMHYGRTAFSTNGRPTIVPKKSTTANIGQRRSMTRSDIKRIKKLYQC